MIAPGILPAAISPRIKSPTRCSLTGDKLAGAATPSAWPARGHPTPKAADEMASAAAKQRRLRRRLGKRSLLRGVMDQGHSGRAARILLDSVGTRLAKFSQSVRMQPGTAVGKAAKDHLVQNGSASQGCARGRGGHRQRPTG